MLIDSGSEYNIIDESSWFYIQQNNAEIYNIRNSCSKIFKAFATTTTLRIKLVFNANIRVGSREEMDVEFFVIENAEISLLGKSTAIKLGVLKIGLNCRNVLFIKFRIKQYLFQK